MNKLLKVTLITAIMATSGMACGNGNPFPQPAPEQDSCGHMMKFALCAAAAYTAHKVLCDDSFPTITISENAFKKLVSDSSLSQPIRQGKWTSDGKVRFDNPVPHFYDDVACKSVIVGFCSNRGNSSSIFKAAKLSDRFIIKEDRVNVAATYNVNYLDGSTLNSIDGETVYAAIWADLLDPLKK